MTGSEEAPTVSTWVSESPEPRTTMLACNTRFPAKPAPARIVAPGRISAASNAPMTMPKTGPPTTGTSAPSQLASAATRTTKPSPASVRVARGRPSLVVVSGAPAGRGEVMGAPVVVSSLASIARSG